MYKDKGPKQSYWVWQERLKFFGTFPLLVLILLSPTSLVPGLPPTVSAIRASPSEAATISLVSISQGYFTSGETVTADLTVKNTGNDRQPFYVELSLQDVNLKWWNASYMQIALDPGTQSSIMPLSWQIDPATPTGPMTAKVTVWADQFEGRFRTELGSQVEADAFSVYPASAKRPVSITATWLDPGSAYPANIPTTISTLLWHGVNVVFLNVGCLDSSGHWNPQTQLNYSRFVSEAKIAGLSVIAWINQGESCGDVSGRVSGQDMVNPTTRTNVANVVSSLTSATSGFDGVQFDIEPLAWDSAFLSGYIGLLRAVRPQNYSGHFQVYVPIGSLRYARNSDFLSEFISKLSQVGVTEVVNSIYNSGRNSVSAYQSLLVSDVQWMTTNSKVKVIFGLPAYEGETALHDPSVENIGNALIGIWMAVSSSGVNRTQFGGVAAYSYPEFDASKWRILDQLWTNHPMETVSTTRALTDNASSTVATTTSSTAEEQPSCVIATAAYGSELAVPVQFLRNFRDGQVKRTYVGSHFLSAFNAWYYSWAPSVAKQEARNGVLRGIVRVTILPLLGALFIARQIFTGFAGVNYELAMVVAGFAASTLIGAAYLAPLAYGMKRFARRRLSRRAFIYAAVFAAALALFGTLTHGMTGITENLTAIFVLECIIIPPLALTRKLP